MKKTAKPQKSQEEKLADARQKFDRAVVTLTAMNAPGTPKEPRVYDLACRDISRYYALVKNHELAFAVVDKVEVSGEFTAHRAFLLKRLRKDGAPLDLLEQALKRFASEAFIEDGDPTRTAEEWRAALKVLRRLSPKHAKAIISLTADHAPENSPIGQLAKQLNDPSGTKLPKKSKDKPRASDHTPLEPNKKRGQSAATRSKAPA